jgi:hypothetical protein
MINLLANIILISLSAVVTVAISERILGRKISIAAAYQRVGSKLFTFVGAILLVILLAVVIFIGIVILSAILTALFGLRGSWEIRIMALTIAFVVFALMAWFLFIPQAVLLEGTRAAASIGRSIDLVKGKFWKVVGVLILIYIAISLIGLFFRLAAGAIMAMVDGGLTSYADLMSSMRRLQQIRIVSGIINFFLEPFRMIVVTLLYYDIRVRKEAYDTQLMAEELAIEIAQSDEQP